MIYIDVGELGTYFKSLNLNKNNILDFLISDNNNQFSYLLKLYLISSIENHQHIDRFNRVCYLIDDYKSSYIEEIIENKKFKPVLDKAEKISKDDSLEQDLGIYVYGYSHFDIEKFFSVYILNEDSKKISLSSKILNKLKNNYDKMLIKRKFNKHNDLSSTPIEEIIKYYSKIQEKFKNKDIGELKKILLWLLIDKYEEKTLITNFQLDLNFNYQILIKLFDPDFLNKNSVSDIIYAIRSVMVENDISKEKISSLEMTTDTYIPPEDLSTNYRNGNLSTTNINGNLIKTNSFFANTSDYKNINNDMLELEEQYKEISQLENDEDYLKAAYNLSKRFLQIHPFADGNGRTFKYLFYYLCLKRNILPPTITDTVECTPCYFGTFNDDNSNYIMGRSKILERRIRNF